MWNCWESTVVTWKVSLAHAFTQLFCAIQMYLQSINNLFNIERGFLIWFVPFKMYVSMFCMYLQFVFYLADCPFPYPIACITCLVLWSHLGWFCSCVKTASKHFEGN